MSGSKNYDIFISHAGADADVALQLYSLLHPQVRVFLDSESIMLGDDWDTAILKAQHNSRITVVLVSSRTEEAFYQREEIAAAIELARQNREAHRVVPIYLGDPPTVVPPGLRLKQRLVVTDPETLESAADRLIDLHHTLVGNRSAAASLDQVPHINVAATKTLPELVEHLFSGNPVVSLPAAEALREGPPEVIAMIVDRLQGLRELDVIAVRSVLAAFPAQSAEPLLGRLFTASQDWGAAVNVPKCLTPAHRAVCGDRLAAQLTSSNISVTQLSIEALGYIGEEAWGHRLVELVEDWYEYSRNDLFSKFFTYALPARARMLVLSGGDTIEDAWSIPPSFSDVETLVAIADEVGSNAHMAIRELEMVLTACTPRHADHLISTWLATGKGSLPVLAARALGNIGLHRALPHLVQAANGAGSDRLGHEARFAIAGIGGAKACDVLAQMMTNADAQISTDARWALAHCVAEARDDSQFAELIRELLAHDVNEQCWTYRAVGRRRDHRFIDEVRDGLSNAEPTVRAHSALALARLQGDTCRAELLHAYSEASTRMEKIFAALALLVIGTFPPGDPDLQLLQTDLAKDSFLYKKLSRDDISDVLDGSDHPAAKSMAAAWRTVYTMNLVRY